ncbi:hypothetical protein ACMC5R_07285 [Deferribacteres bacterium DY0037]
MKDFDHNLPAPTLSYDEYIEGLPESSEYTCERTIPVCNELVAVIEERVRYNDKKLFDKTKGYYKPHDIVVVGTRMRPQFLGLFHTEEFINVPNFRLKPMEAVELMSVLDGFASNCLNTGRVYRRSAFSFWMEKRENNVLCIDYGEDLKQSYLDRCYCKITAGVLRTIIANCDFWL